MIWNCFNKEKDTQYTQQYLQKCGAPKKEFPGDQANAGKEEKHFKSHLRQYMVKHPNDAIEVSAKCVSDGGLQASLRMQRGMWTLKLWRVALLWKSKVTRDNQLTAAMSRGRTRS